jgi:hypothetical protein
MKYHFESLNYLDNREIKEDHANGLGLHLCNYYPLGVRKSPTVKNWRLCINIIS